MAQQLLIAGSGAVLGLAAAFLAIGVAIVIAIERPSKKHAYWFFGLSVLMLASYVLLWQLASAAISPGSEATNGHAGLADGGFPLSLAHKVSQWIFDHETLSAGLLTAIVLIVALIVAARQLNAMRRDRATSIALDLRQSYESGLVFQGRSLVNKIVRWYESHGVASHDIPEKFANSVTYYKQNYPDDFMKVTSVPALFDIMGWLVRKKCCKAKWVDEQLDWEGHYKIWEPYIRQIQGKAPGEKLNSEAAAFYGNFVWLVDQLRPQR